jgi:hypothetical protein
MKQLQNHVFLVQVKQKVLSIMEPVIIVRPHQVIQNVNLLAVLLPNAMNKAAVQMFQFQEEDAIVAFLPPSFPLEVFHIILQFHKVREQYVLAVLALQAVLPPIFLRELGYQYPHHHLPVIH